MNINDIITGFFEQQKDVERKIETDQKKQNGIFFTSNIDLINEVLSIIDFQDRSLLDKKILEPSGGAGIFIIALILKMYEAKYSKDEIRNFISKNLFFIEKNEDFLNLAQNNLKELYFMLFKEKYVDKLNFCVCDFTNKDEVLSKITTKFDYIIGNPPFVSLYGRRAVNKTEELRNYYLTNYIQFPKTLKDGKINLSMLFLEQSLSLLKSGGKCGFILDITFFETAFLYTRKYLIDNLYISKIIHNISSFDNVASGQIILVTENKKNNEIEIVDHLNNNSFKIKTTEIDTVDYKIYLKNNTESLKIMDKLIHYPSLGNYLPPKSLRTAVMLLNFEDKFTTDDITSNLDKELIYPYYQGGKSLKEKNGPLIYKKLFFYNRELQNKINDELREELEKQGIKNKKRIGLGEIAIYENPKIFIRQSAKELITAYDDKKSSSNNSLYVISFRNNEKESIEKLKFLAGYLNSTLATFYAQQSGIIRYSKGKQPQIKISDLNKLPIINDKTLFNEILNNFSDLQYINSKIYDFLKLSKDEISYIEKEVELFKNL